MKMKGYLFINYMQTAGLFKPSNRTATKKKKNNNKRGVASELKSSCPKAWLFQDVHCVTADTKHQHCVFLPQVTPKPGRTSLFPGIQTILLEQTVSQS